MPYEKYMENSILFLSPEELTLMLYKGLVKFIKQAQLAITEKDMSRAHDCIVQAKKILISFENTLDMKYEVSESLLKMYEYMIKRLTQANVKKDNTILTEILGFAEEMRDTWSQAIKIYKNPGGLSPASKR
jgi:flagellar biosynthetic protein FliS